ncbi:hypothetical protein A2U01_0040088, partial [Trifolium medium]|nr:hypothetical protein [Trifolium medium]
KAKTDEPPMAIIAAHLRPCACTVSSGADFSGGGLMSEWTRVATKRKKEEDGVSAPSLQQRLPQSHPSFI